MKILQFVADGAPGGGTTHVRQLLRGFQHEHEVGLLTQTDSFLEQTAQESGVPVFTGDFFRGPLSRVNPRCARAVRQAIHEFHPEVIHCHGGRAAFYRSFSADSVPTVYTAHGLHYSRKKSSLQRILGRLGEQWACRRIDHAIYVCRSDADLARTDRLVKADTPLSVIYPSIAPHSRARSQNSSASPTVGFIGRLVTQKNPTAFLQLVAALPGVRAVIGGGGPLEPELKTLCAELNLENRCEFRGELTPGEVQDLMCQLDVLVMTSLWEGLPALLLEAMYVGVPVVSTAVGGIAEIVEHGRTGLLSPHADPAELASLVRRLIDDPQQAQQIAATAREQLTAKFLEPAMVAAVKQVYEQVLERRGLAA